MQQHLSLVEERRERREASVNYRSVHSASPMQQLSSHHEKQRKRSRSRSCQNKSNDIRQIGSHQSELEKEELNSELGEEEFNDDAAGAINSNQAQQHSNQEQVQTSRKNDEVNLNSSTSLLGRCRIDSDCFIEPRRPPKASSSRRGGANRGAGGVYSASPIDSQDQF